MKKLFLCAALALGFNAPLHTEGLKDALLNTGYEVSGTLTAVVAGFIGAYALRHGESPEVFAPLAILGGTTVAIQGFRWTGPIRETFGLVEKEQEKDKEDKEQTEE